MTGFDGRIGAVGSGDSTTSVDFWTKYAQQKDDIRNGQDGGAYIGNLLNGSKECPQYA